MNWRVLYSPNALLFGFCASMLVLSLSVNIELWVAAFGALLLSVMLVSDPHRDYPVLVWVVGFNWLGVVAAIMFADLLGIPLADMHIGSFRVQAVQYSLVSLIFFAGGIAVVMRSGRGIDNLTESRDAARYERPIPILFNVAGYGASLVVAEIGTSIAFNFPQLQQPLVALYYLKFIFVYLVAATAFSSGRGYAWLVLILSLEVVNGMTSFFGTFKEAFFLVLIALVAVGRRPSPGMCLFGGASVALVLLLSLMWTAVKPEYRLWVSGFTGEQIIVRSFEERVTWMTDRLLDNDFVYGKALEQLVDRVDTTDVFAQYLARVSEGLHIEMPSRYLAGIEHALMPRALFPDKDTIDDSGVTAAMTGRRIGLNTSISIGYIAEAYYDFGPRWMFLPILLIGCAVGAVGRYFMTRDAPYLVRQGFASVALFIFFQFGVNFNKAMGTFLVGFMMLALVLKFGYPIAARWIGGIDARGAKVVKLTGAE